MTVAVGSIANGLVWTLVSRGGSQIVQLIFSIMLARLLLPADFGTMGMLLVFSGFAQLFVDTGLTSALIHREKVEPIDLATVFWLQAAIGALLTGLLFVLAAPIATFFHNPQLQMLSRAMSCVFLLQVIGQVPGAMLRRELRFRYLSLVSVSSALVSGSLSIGLAALGYGPWAILWQVLLSTAISSLLQAWGYSWRPALTFSRQSARELGGYGGYLLGHSTLNYWLRNGDNLLIGRYLGAADLGLYTRAYSLMLLPLNNISATFGQVLFPSLARMQADPERFRSVYLRALRLIAFASFPIMAGLALLSRQAILILYGSRWIGVVPIFAVLACVGMLQSIVFPVGWVYTSLGRTKDQFILSVFLAAAFVPAMWLGIIYGIFGVTIGYAIWTLLSAVANIYFAGRLTGITLAHTVNLLWKIIAATAIMAVAVFMVNRLIVDRVSLFASGALGAVLGASVYAGMCRLLGEDAFRDCVAMVGARSRQHRVMPA